MITLQTKAIVGSEFPSASPATNAPWAEGEGEGGSLHGDHGLHDHDRGRAMDTAPGVQELKDDTSTTTSASASAGEPDGRADADGACEWLVGSSPLCTPTSSPLVVNRKSFLPVAAGARGTEEPRSPSALLLSRPRPQPRIDDDLLAKAVKSSRLSLKAQARSSSLIPHPYPSSALSD